MLFYLKAQYLNPLQFIFSYATLPNLHIWSRCLCLHQTTVQKWTRTFLWFGKHQPFLKGINLKTKNVWKSKPDVLQSISVMKTTWLTVIEAHFKAVFLKWKLFGSHLCIIKASHLSGDKNIYVNLKLWHKNTWISQLLNPGSRNGLGKEPLQRLRSDKQARIWIIGWDTWGKRKTVKCL